MPQQGFKNTLSSSEDTFYRAVSKYLEQPETNPLSKDEQELLIAAMGVIKTTDHSWDWPYLVSLFTDFNIPDTCEESSKEGLLLCYKDMRKLPHLMRLLHNFESGPTDTAPCIIVPQ